MRYSWAQHGGIGALLVGLLAGCGGAAPQGGAGGAGLPLETPPGLTGARLLYQRADGIYWRELGRGGARRLAAQGTWPRWAPDGKSVVFLRGRQVVLCDLATQAERVVAEVAQARTVAFHPDGRRVLVAARQSVEAIALADGRRTLVRRGEAVYELDVAGAGDFFVATVKSRGYRVRRYAWASGASAELGRGCSASVSPDGQWVTINVDGHRELVVVNAQTGQKQHGLRAPEGARLDNQKWSNHPDWIAGIIEGPVQDIVVQRATDGRVWRVTDAGDADRPDLWVEDGAP